MAKARSIVSEIEQLASIHQALEGFETLLSLQSRRLETLAAELTQVREAVAKSREAPWATMIGGFSTLFVVVVALGAALIAPITSKDEHQDANINNAVTALRVLDDKLRSLEMNSIEKLARIDMEMKGRGNKVRD